VPKASAAKGEQWAETIIMGAVSKDRTVGKTVRVAEAIIALGAKTKVQLGLYSAGCLARLAGYLSRSNSTSKSGLIPPITLCRMVAGYIGAVTRLSHIPRDTKCGV